MEVLADRQAAAALSQLTQGEVARQDSVMAEMHPAPAMDDVHIVIRKFLTCNSNQVRRHGVIGAVCLLAQRGRARRMNAKYAEEGERDDDETCLDVDPRMDIDDGLADNGGEVGAMEMTIRSLSHEAMVEV